MEKEKVKKVSDEKVKVKALDVETMEVVTYEATPCPTCDKWITKIYNYCPHCAQKIEQ